MCPKRALLIKIERTIIHFNIQVIDSSTYSNISVTGWLFFFFHCYYLQKKKKWKKKNRRENVKAVFRILINLEASEVILSAASNNMFCSKLFGCLRSSPWGRARRCIEYAMNKLRCKKTKS